MTIVDGDPDTGNPTVIPVTLDRGAEEVIGIQVGLIMTGDHTLNGALFFLELLPPGTDHSPTSTDWFDVNGSFPDPHSSTMIVNGTEAWDDGIGWVEEGVYDESIAYFSDAYPDKMAVTVQSVVPSIGPYVGTWAPYGLDSLPFHGLDTLLDFYDPDDEWAFRVMFFGEGSIEIVYLSLHLCLESGQRIVMIV